jgi:hypothetical protein
MLDKAAVLHYARILSKDERWVSCECCFTVVHDVMVACTSIYLRGEKSERRALEAPQIRRIFSCSPRDPRYHMLEHLSPKFRMPPVEREPRAALILNRFTRTLSIMFATNAVATILGMRPDEIKDKSFYDCIQENCLPDAMRCLESAKANESIAYLRFWFRDPRDPEELDDDDEDEDEDDEDMGRGSNRDSESMDSESGGVPLNEDTDMDGGFPFDNPGRAANGFEARGPVPAQPLRPSRTPERSRNRGREPEPLELEAVVSCTSDGLVVVLRKARPPIPAPVPQPLLAPAIPAAPVAPVAPVPNYQNGLFAAPWGQNPIQPYVPQEQLYTFRPPLLPQYMPLQESVKAAGGPPVDQLMRSIRDVAVFAWALVGINGNLANYGRGVPLDRAQPDALPIWDPEAGNTGYQPPENRAAQRWLSRDKGKGVDGRDASYDRFDRQAPYPSRKPAQQLPPPRAAFAPMQQPLTPGLENYTYGGAYGSFSWSQPTPQYRPNAYEQPAYERTSYEQPTHERTTYEQPSYHRHRDPWAEGPPVLPPIQVENYESNPQPHRFDYLPPPPPLLHPQAPTQPLSGSSSSQGSYSTTAQPHDSQRGATTPQAYAGPGLPPTTQPAAPVPPTQNLSALRYLWQ